MSDWTPGPWEWRTERAKEIRLKRDHWSVGAVDSNKGVALVFRDEANARLIAASPDLRKAASFALAVLYGSNSDKQGAIRKLEQAIDKAEGIE